MFYRNESYLPKETIKLINKKEKLEKELKEIYIKLGIDEPV
tara:strand:- start:28 stop:150 length:123 start_codon:yes stop_codon:yes gene_type:complete